MTMSRGARASTWTVIGILAVLALGYAAVVSSMGSGFRENTAATALQPILEEVEALGGERVCSHGDAGYSPSNNQPWEHVTFAVPNGDLQEQLTRIAADSGYRLQPLDLGKMVDDVILQDGEDGGHQLTVAILETDQPVVLCSAGDPVQSEDGEVFVEVNLSLERINR